MSDAVIAQTPQKSATQSSPQFQVGVHLSRAKPDSGEPDMGAIARETADAIAGNIEQPVMTPTRSSFLAKWQPVSGATGYRLDVSTSRSFDSCVSNYRDLDVGNVTSHIVAGSTREQSITIAFGLITPPALAITRKPRARRRRNSAPDW
jgi:hypothetical protein